MANESLNQVVSVDPEIKWAMDDLGDLHNISLSGPETIIPNDMLGRFINASSLITERISDGEFVPAYKLDEALCEVRVLKENLDLTKTQLAEQKERQLAEQEELEGIKGKLSKQREEILDVTERLGEINKTFGATTISESTEKLKNVYIFLEDLETFITND
jgi:hypothetical protein